MKMPMWLGVFKAMQGFLAALPRFTACCLSCWQLTSETNRRKSFTQIWCGGFSNAWQALRNDLNTPAVLGALFNGLKKARSGADSPEAALQALKPAGALLYVLGVQLFARPDESESEQAAPTDVQSLAEDRWAAKQARDFSRADALRQEIAGKGWLVLDGPDGYTLKPNS